MFHDCYLHLVIENVLILQVCARTGYRHQLQPRKIICLISDPIIYCYSIKSKKMFEYLTSLAPYIFRLLSFILLRSFENYK